jgi:hypothetical protein
MSLFWTGGAGFPTGIDGFSFFLLAVGTALPEEMASYLQPLQSLHIPQLLAAGAVEMFFFSVRLFQHLPHIFQFIHLPTILNFRHRASCILGQAFHYSPENAFYIFNQQIYFII